MFHSFSVEPGVSKTTCPVPVPYDESSFHYGEGVRKSLALTREEQVLKVALIWGDYVISCEQYRGTQPITIGELARVGQIGELLLPESCLGAAQLPLLSVDEHLLYLSILGSMSGYIRDWEGQCTSLDFLRSRRAAILGPGSVYRIPVTNEIAGVFLEFGRFSIVLTWGEAESIPPHKFTSRFDVPLLLSFGGMVATFGSIIAALTSFVPPLGLTEGDDVTDEQRILMTQYLARAAEREQHSEEYEAAVTDARDTSSTSNTSPSALRSAGPMGKAGSYTSRAQEGRLALRGPTDNLAPAITRGEALREAKTFGVVSLLGALNTEFASTLSSPWGGDGALGRDAMDADGHLWGDAIGDGTGSGGLHLSGEGSGAGGPGTGISMNMNAIAGSCAGAPDMSSCAALLSGHGRWGHVSGGAHKVRVPRVTASPSVVSGHLPPEVVQRTIRQNFGRYRFCYEQGLARNPGLEGRVVVRFVIGRDGAVSNVQDGGSSLMDASVKGCILNAFYGLSFPPPETGVVSVHYPLTLTAN